MIRKSIENLVPYTVNQIENVIRLDANENSFNIPVSIKTEINRYPDSDAKELRDEIANFLSVEADDIIAGNGSSEMIELLMRTYIDQGDTILGFDLSFSMYKIFAQIYGAEYATVDNNNYIMDMDALIDTAQVKNPKMIIVCNPNNPTGYLINKIDIERLLKSTKSLVVVDEAYIEFCEGSMVNRLRDYDNLVVLRTFSKAWGLAGARVGYMISSPQVIGNISKVKAPYNLNALSQSVAINALKNKEAIFDNINTIINQREWLYEQMLQQGIKVYKSAANFLYFEADEDLYMNLIDSGVLIRQLGNNKFRVTIGSQSENNLFVKSLIMLKKRMIG